MGRALCINGSHKCRSSPAKDCTPSTTQNNLTFDRASNSSSEMMGLLDLVASEGIILPSSNLLFLHVKLFMRYLILATLVGQLGSGTRDLAPVFGSKETNPGRFEFDKRKGVQNTQLRAFFGLIGCNQRQRLAEAQRHFLDVKITLPLLVAPLFHKMQQSLTKCATAPFP